MSVQQAGISGVYYIYLQKICSTSIANGSETTADRTVVDDCRSWEDAGDGKLVLDGAV
jgi:hypothetical protein